MNITEEHAKKVLTLLSHGLVKGLGKPKPGQMCIEAAITVALDLPFNDNPSCVSNAVRDAKIVLNDCNWSSNQARAEGMKKLALAQLGSDILDDEVFKDELKLASMKKLVPWLIQKHYDKEKDEKLLVWKAKFENLVELDDDELWKEFYKNNYYNYYCNYNCYCYCNYNCYCYCNYNCYCYYYGDEWLLLIADTILDVLKEMNSPGCKWLYLI